MPSAAPALSPAPPAPILSPSPLQAIAVVVAYFVLQLLLALPIYGLERYLASHALPGRLGADLLLWATCLDLLLAGLLSLYAIRRQWPQAWAAGGPAGLGWRPVGRRPLLAGVLCGLLLMPLVGSWLTEWLAHGQAITEQIDALILHADGWARLPIIVLSVSLVPLVEETLFRGVLLSAVWQRHGPAVAVGISSTAFALAHLASLNGQWYALPALALFALCLAGLRIRSHSLWPGVLAHACNNLLAMAAILHA